MEFDVRTLFPKIYDDYIEIDEISKNENLLFKNAKEETERVRNNTFVSQCDEQGIKEYESFMQIIPDANRESLEFRKQRVINRLTTKPPFTIKFLEEKLDTLIGKDKWTLIKDYNNFRVIIESSAANQQWFEEISVTMNLIKPCNIVFINVPLLETTITAGEMISYATAQYNYLLGVSFILNKTPFGEYVDKGVIKTESTKSLELKMLADLASALISNINKVRINDNIEISEFSIKETEDNKATLVFDVVPTEELKEITEIKVLNADNEILSKNTVYIPLAEPVTIKHIFTVREV